MLWVASLCAHHILLLVVVVLVSVDFSTVARDVLASQLHRLGQLGVALWLVGCVGDDLGGHGVLPLTCVHGSLYHVDGLLLVLESGKPTESQVISPVEATIVVGVLHASWPVVLALDVLYDLTPLALILLAGCHLVDLSSDDTLLGGNSPVELVDECLHVSAVDRVLLVEEDPLLVVEFLELVNGPLHAGEKSI